MPLIVRLALKDLGRDWLHLFCNVAVIIGVIVPLLVLFGVKNGVYEALIGRLMSDPASLQIDTSGNHEFLWDDLVEVQAWPDVAFATLKTRSLFDFVNIRASGGREIREAVLVPSGKGDPTLPDGLAFEDDDVAVSALLAEQLGLKRGTAVEMITQATDRPRQLVLDATIVAVIPPDRMAGRTVLADLSVLDLIEAFYDEYALPDYGIAVGRSLDDRAPVFEGMRVFVRHLEDLKTVQARAEARFGIATVARTREVEAVLGLGRNLDLALMLTASVAGLGLAATLVFSFWGEVARKRRTIAAMSLLGIARIEIAAFPVVQALVTAMLGLLVSFALFGVASRVAEWMFSGDLASEPLVRMSVGQAVAVALSVIVLVVLSASAAARRAASIDPAIILREVG